MRNVDPPIRQMVAIRIDLRPTRSPKCPQIAAPTGRAMNAIEKVDSANNVPVMGSTSGK